jgi:mannosyltransferase
VAATHTADPEVAAAAPAVEPAPRRSGTTRVVVAAAVALQVALAVWGLTRHSLWLDEAVSLGATAQLTRTWRETAGTMALYYLGLDGWTALFGTSVAAVRSLSVLAAAATVVAAAAAFRHLVDRRVAAVALVVLAASPGLTRYAQEARSYALVALVTALCWWVGARAVAATLADDQGAARRWWAGLTALAVVGVLSHGLFPLQLLGLAASLLVVPERRRLLRGLAPALGAAVATVVVLSRQGADRIADWIPPLRPSQLVDVGSELVGRPLPVALVVLGLAAVGTAVAVRRPAPTSLDRRPAPTSLDRWRALAPVCWALVPLVVLVLVSTRRPYLIPRYLLASTPGLALLVALGAVALVDRAGGLSPAARRVAPVAVGALLVGALVWGQLSVHDRTAYDWAGAADVVAADVQPGDALLVTSPPIRMPFEAAWLDVDAAADPEPLWGTRPLGEVHRFDAYGPFAEAVAALDAHDRVWVVHQTTVGLGDQPLDDLLALDAVEDRYRVATVDRFAGGVQVLRLDPR